MSTGKHIDKICIAAIAVTLVLTILFMNGAGLGIASAQRVMGYENSLFDTDRVHTLDIVMQDWDSFIETCESETYSACTVLIDGEKFSNIGIRAKGNTSLSSVKSMDSRRYSFKLEFDQYEKGKSYHGLDKLCLNNLIQDNTMMKDFIAYRLMAENGVEAPLCSYVFITVNGEDWGLYLAVEGVEDSFLQRNYGSDTGELYKPDSMSFGGGRGNGMDFSMSEFNFENADGQESADADGNSDRPTFPGQGSMPDNFPFGGQMPDMPDGFDPSSGEWPSMAEGEMPSMPGGAVSFGMGSSDVKLQYTDDDPDSYPNIFDNAKTDVSKADQSRLISSLKQLNEYTNLDTVVNMEEVLRYFVVHNFIVNGDSYTGAMIHNYYLHEKDGMLSMIPWDYNLGFGTFQGGNASDSVNASIDSPVTGGNSDDRPMLGWIFSDEAYTERYHALFAQFLSEWLENGKLTQLIADTAEMIRPYVAKDTTRFCTEEAFEKGVEAITQFVTLRTEAIRRQLSGDTEKVDASALNVSDMGTMSNGAGGGRGGFSSPDKTGGRSDNSNTETASQSESASPEATNNGSFTPPSGGAPNGGSFTPPSGGAPDGGSFTPPSSGAPDGGSFTPPSSGAPNDGSFTPSFGGNVEGSIGDSSGNPASEAAPANAVSGQGKPDASTSATQKRENGQSTEQNTQAAGSSETGDAASSKQTGPSRNGQTPFPEAQKGSSDLTAYIWVAVSAIVMAAGLLIARIKKYG